MTIIQTIAKVFSFSLGISLCIKYGISQLTVPSDNLVALLIVLTPTIIMIGWLGRSNSKILSPERQNADR
jgi:hypothetical protein